MELNAAESTNPYSFLQFTNILQYSINTKIICSCSKQFYLLQRVLCTSCWRVWDWRYSSTHS